MKEFLHRTDVLVVYFLFMSYTWYLLLMGLRGFFMKPWKGWNQHAILAVVSQFAHLPEELTIKIQSPKHNKKILFANGWYIAQTQSLYIDTSHVRSEKELVNTLLHEICHHNQFVGNRLAIGLGGSYYFRPAEKEARAFAEIWHPIAMAIYRKNKLKK